MSSTEKTSSGKEINYTFENKRQYCVEVETERQIIIFPCAVIGATYYFTSTPIRNQIFAGNLQGLYESVELDEEIKTARIVMKPEAPNEDAKNIVRFVKDRFANKLWRAIRNDVVREKKLLDMDRGE